MIQEKPVEIQLLEKLNRDNMYVVQKILKKRTIVRRGTQKIMYYVRWKGYPDPKDHTWQPCEHLESVPELVQQFQRKLEEKQSRQEKIKDIDKEQKAKTEASKYLASNNQIQINQNQNQNHDRINEISGHKKPKVQLETKQYNQKANKIQNNIFEQKKLNKSQCVPEKLDDQKPTFIQKPKLEVNNQKKYPPQKKFVNGQKNRQLNQQAREKSKQEKPTKSGQKKQTNLYGKVVNHFYNDKTLFFQVQKLTSDNRIEKIIQISNDTASSQCLKDTYNYLEKLVIQLEEERLSR